MYMKKGKNRPGGNPRSQGTRAGKRLPNYCDFSVCAPETLKHSPANFDESRKYLYRIVFIINKYILTKYKLWLWYICYSRKKTAEWILMTFALIELKIT